MDVISLKNSFKVISPSPSASIYFYIFIYLSLDNYKSLNSYKNSALDNLPLWSLSRVVNNRFNLSALSIFFILTVARTNSL